ncbi:MAG: type IV pilin N-terminal domain-containing protein, partial [Thermoplasmata archaeon]
MKEKGNSSERGKRIPFRSNRSGISEVIAQILILAITVTLFSTIFMWVQAMPPPQSAPKTELKASLEIKGAGPFTYYINMTHLKGEPLFNHSTKIYITVI